MTDAEVYGEHRSCVNRDLCIKLQRKLLMHNDLRSECVSGSILFITETTARKPRDKGCPSRIEAPNLVTETGTVRCHRFQHFDSSTARKPVRSPDSPLIIGGKSTLRQAPLIPFFLI